MKPATISVSDNRKMMPGHLFACLLMVLFFFCPASWANDAAEGASRPGEDQGLYWRIRKDGREAGYLLGTIHSEDPRVVDFTEEFIDQLNSCQVFAMEMVPDLPTLKRLTEFMHYGDSTSLEAVLGPERYQRAMQALSSYQVPKDWKARMKVWAVVMTLSVPAPVTGFFMDLSLSLRAAGNGLHVIGLETLEQQLNFLEQMPLDFQITLLDHALDDYRRVAEIHEQMVQVYLKDSLAALDELSQEQFAELDPEIARYFNDLGIDARNQQMASNVIPRLEKKRVFIAVGALHLSGPQGLVKLLREAGFELTALPMPFQRNPQGGLLSQTQLIR
jgi:uncharacterized protein YbaP (TraB family)